MEAGQSKMNAHQGRIAKRAKIVALHEAGFNPTEIQRRLGVTRKTVYKWIERDEDTGNLADLPKGRPPKVTTAEDDQAIVAEVERAPFTNAVKIRASLGLTCSAETVRKRLRGANIKHRVPAVKEALTDQHREARLTFAHQYKVIGEEDPLFWKRVIFTDEKTFSSTTHGKLHIWRKDGTRYDRDHIYELKRSGHTTCNVWGYMSAHGVGDLVRIQGRFTQDRYLQILSEDLPASLANRAYNFPSGPIYILQDRCPIHTARRVREWFANNDRFRLLELPSKSMDCNPIENMWANVVNSWEPEEERNGEQLWLHTQRQWEMFRNRPETARNHALSMPDRLQAVINRMGGWDRY